VATANYVDCVRCGEVVSESRHRQYIAAVSAPANQPTIAAAISTSNIVSFAQANKGAAAAAIAFAVLNPDTAPDSDAFAASICKAINTAHAFAHPAAVSEAYSLAYFASVFVPLYQTYSEANTVAHAPTQSRANTPTVAAPNTLPAAHTGAYCATFGAAGRKRNCVRPCISARYANA
jgi:hypothetical protein